MSDPAHIRVGDAERDAAIDALREHAADGRLSSEEFSERMGRALEARTRGELAALFGDLPSASLPAPAPVPAPPAQPEPYLAYPAVRPRPSGSGNWWWLVAVIVILVLVTRGNLFPLLIIGVIGYSMVRPKLTAKPDPHAPLRYLAPEEQAEIDYLIRGERKIEAIKRYREITGADLRTARQSIEMWERDLGR